MHHPSVIQHHAEAYEASTGTRLQRLPLEVCRSMTAQLAKTRSRDGEILRPYTSTERRFIRNELALCRFDFRYWADRYAFILAGDEDSSGVQLFSPWGSQRILLDRIARLEAEMFDASRRGETVSGICMIVHKAGQLGATAVCQLLLTHRVNFYRGTRALTASVDEPNVQIAHRRMTRAYHQMPFWMQAALKSESMERGMIFDPMGMDSVCELQHFKLTDKGVGMGEQWDASHLTECASAPNFLKLYDLIPRIPRRWNALSLWESTSQLQGVGAADGGRSWKDFTEQVRTGSAEGGAGRFGYCFIPFYAADVADLDPVRKHSLTPPPGWEPSEQTLLMASKAAETSPEFMEGREVDLRAYPDILYWYETTRAQYQTAGNLNKFFTEHPITPEESFQHALAGAFTTETIEALSLEAARYRPAAYKLMTEAEATDARLWAPVEAPVLQAPDGSWFGPMHETEIHRSSGVAHSKRIEERGIIWVRELPRTSYHYVLSGDPSGGIAGWSRDHTQQSDVNVDNGALGIWRREGPAIPCEACAGSGKRPRDQYASGRVSVSKPCPVCLGRGRIGGRAIQCASFAAPIDPEDLGALAASLGRLYAGASEFGEALAVIENNNHGPLTIRAMQRLGYGNFFRMTEIASGTPKPTKKIGWTSGPTTVPVLHNRSRRLLVRGDVVLFSSYTIKELQDAVEMDVATPAGRRSRFEVPKGAGRHDDRMSEMFFALWALFGWVDADEAGFGLALPGATEAEPMPDYAKLPVSAEFQQQAWNEAFGRLTQRADWATALAGIDAYADPDILARVRAITDPAWTPGGYEETFGESWDD